MCWQLIVFSLNQGESVEDSSDYFNKELGWDQTTWAGFNHLVFQKYLFHQNILFTFNLAKLYFTDVFFKEN